MAVQETYRRDLLWVRLTDINGKSTGAVTIYTNNDFDNYFPIAILVIGEDIAGYTSAPTLSFGANAGTANDIVAATLCSVTNTAQYVPLTPKNAAAVVAGGGGVLQLNVTIAAVATTYKFKVAVAGYTGQSQAE